ncbi:MAG TPA: hypothetical protein VMK31_02995 [Sphingomicrobium sp.]|nr:hypothetical protein [Sphingomicrobium sp.]
MAQPDKSLKFGWLPLRSGPATRGAAGIAAAALLAFAFSGSALAARTLFAGGNWAAIDFGDGCEARTKALWARPGTLPIAGFAFDSTGSRQGQFYVRLNRAARPGASVMVKIGSKPFLLAGRGEWAWSASAGQQRAMLEAARYGEAMRVDSRDLRGRRIVDRYTLAGAATAIDSAAAACAGKRR